MLLQAFTLEERIDNAICIEETSKLAITLVAKPNIKYTSPNICMCKKMTLKQ